MLKLKSKLLASVFCLGLMPSIALAASVDFNYQSVYTGPHVFNTETAQPWAKNLEKTSGGELIAHYFMASSLIKENDAVHALIAGTLDMASNGVMFTPDLAPITANSALSFTSSDAIHATKFINKLYNDNKEIQDELAKIGKILNMWAADRAGFFSTVGPITSTNDLKGKRVLVWNGKQIAQVQAWGGIPVQVVPSDTYLGLQRGMGEIFMGPLPVGVAYKIMEVAKDVTPIAVAATPIFTWVSWDLWNDMTPKQQQILVDTTKDWGTKTGTDLVNSTNRDIETMKKAGVKFHEISASELAKFRDLDKPVAVQFVAEDFKRYNVKKDATQWTNYLYKLSSEIK